MFLNTKICIYNFLKFVFVFLFCAMGAYTYCQNFPYPKIVESGAGLNTFAPSAWIVKDSASGDLNGDGLQDIVAVLQYRDSIHVQDDTGVIFHPRLLIILFKVDSAKGFILAEQNNLIVPNDDNPSVTDPYEGVAIKRGILELKTQLFCNMGCWEMGNTSYYFRFWNNGFVLNGAEEYIINRATHAYTARSFDFIKKKLRTEKGNDEKRNRKVASEKLHIEELKTLRMMGKLLSWEVVEGIYL